MSLRRQLYLMTSSVAVAGLVVAPMQSYAQDSGPPADQTPYSQQQSQDPPARVGRLAVLQGTVSTHAAGETQWSPAVLNAPVTDGDAYWTEPSALAEIEISASSVWMSESTEFDTTTLNETALHAAEPQGEVYVHLRSLAPGETYTLETPRGTVTMATNGRYEIGAGDTQNPTTVTVIEGAAQITGNNISLQVHENQTASVTGDSSFEGSVGPMTQDNFLESMLQREQQSAPQGEAAPPVVAQMTGGEDLNAYGSWEDNADYGQVWYPQVGSDWAPYREGRWSYVAPWGWTWVDAEPWGFAPFHYGRWVQIGPRWGWAPVYPGYGYGGGYRPVYAPALVSFFGVGAGIGVGVGIGFGVGLGLGAAFGDGGRIGWVPLGPREPYFPPYGASRAYLSRVNVTNIRNVTNIYNEAGARRDMPIGRYANARAAVVMPARAMADSRPVAGNFSRPNAGELAATHGLVGRAPIAPGARTLGLTPRVAEQLHVAHVQTPHAAGPRVGEGGGVHGAGPLPLRPASGAAPERRPVAEPGHGADRGAPGPQIGHEPGSGGLPGLRQPGERPGEPNAGRHGESAPGPRIAPGDAGRPALRAPGETPTGRTDGARPSGPRTSPAERGGERNAAPERNEPAHTGFEPEQRRTEPARAAPERHAAPAPERHAAPAPEHHAAPAPERRAVPAPERHESAPRPEARPSPAPRPEARPMSAPRPAPRPAAPPHPEPHHGDPKH
jgi:hypothetical protein